MSARSQPATYSVVTGTPEYNQTPAKFSQAVKLYTYPSTSEETISIAVNPSDSGFYFNNDNDWTVEFWWTNTQLSSYPDSTRRTFINGGSFYFTSPQGSGFNVVAAIATSPVTSAQISTPVNTSTFYHIAIVCYSGTITIYEDGVSQLSSSDTVTNTTSRTVSFSKPTGGQLWEFRGDEVRISNIARYTSGFTPSSTPFTDDANTLALFHFDGSGTPTDDILYSANLSTSFSATINAGIITGPNEPIQDYTWDTVPSDTWETFLYDIWGQKGVGLDNQTTITADATVVILGEAELNTNFAVNADADNFKSASATIDSLFDFEVSALSLDIGATILASEFAVQANAGIIHDAASDINSQIDLTASAGIVYDAQATIDSALAFAISALVIQPGQSLFEIQFDIAVDSTVIKRSSAILDTEFSQDTTASVTIDGRAMISDVLGFEVSAGRILRSTAELASEFQADISAVATLSGVSELDLAIDIDVTANRFVGGSAELSAFNFQISRGGVIQPATATLQSALDITASAVMTLDGIATLDSQADVSIRGGVIQPASATLDAFNFFFSEGRFSDVRGSALLATAFVLESQGDLKLLESLFTLKVLPETRTTIIDSEQRKQKILPDLNAYVVESEARTLPILPESRLLEIE